MADFRISITGLPELIDTLGDDGLLDDMLRPGMTKAGVIVEGAWKGNVHTVTRKYQGSIQSDVTGEGADIAARIGPRPGFVTPRGYTKADTARWKKPRDGKNRGDPREYAIFEEQGTRYRPGHPAAEPALTENEDRITDVIAREAGRALERRLR